MKAQSRVTKIGNSTFSIGCTGRTWCILILRSASVVSARMIGGWMSGTSAMYEYAATAIEPIRCGANFEET